MSQSSLNETYKVFCQKVGELEDLSKAGAVLSWDEQTYMPPKSAGARAQQLSTLSTVIHEKLTSNEFDELLKKLKDSENQLTADQKLAVKRFDFVRDRMVKLPTKLVEELSKAQSAGFQAWREARVKKNFSIFKAPLENLLKLTREKADLFGWEDTPWNGLSPDFERGMTAKKVEELFTPLREATVKLLQKIQEKPQLNVQFLEQKWDSNIQLEFSRRIARDLGYDFESGRIDIADHPFATSVGIKDVRITTRVAEDDLFNCLFSTIHEVGHALYEQGFKDSDERTALAECPSLGIHESQSRFWEVIIGRSLPFWKHYFPILKQYYPGKLEGVSCEDFYRAANMVKPNFIRTEADEVCYNLHIMIRFELEVPLLSGDLSIADLPTEWNRRYKDYLGIDIPHDGVGCLQDVHWSGGAFGYFPSYTFGNIYSALLLEKMENDVPDLWSEIEQARFQKPLRWLRENIHQVGNRKDPVELIEGITGKKADSETLVNRLESKYSEIYQL